MALAAKREPNLGAGAAPSTIKPFSWVSTTQINRLLKNSNQSSRDSG
jgi:hypothetical protein